MSTLDKAIHKRLQRFYSHDENPIKNMLLTYGVCFLYKFNFHNRLIWKEKKITKLDNAILDFYEVEMLIKTLDVKSFFISSEFIWICKLGDDGKLVWKSKKVG